MFKRTLKPSVSQSFFLFGPRGSGKSTLVDRLFKDKKPWVINLLSSEQEDRYLRDPDLLERELNQKKNAPEWIFIDEVQKIPKLLDVVHKLIEEQKQKFILTGSSSRKLKAHSANLLAGRAFVYHLHPLTYSEIEDEFDLSFALRWGSLPKIFSYTNDSDRKAFLRAYSLTYLKEEVRLEQLVRELEPFRDFMEIAAQCSGKILNYSEIARDIGVDYKTVQNYFTILEDTWFGFFLPAFHRSIRKSQLESPKFYLFDLGVKNSLTGEVDSVPVPSTSFYGASFEHFVVQECYRLNDYSTRDYRLSHFATKNGGKVDLILSKGMKELILVEIKSSSQVDVKKVEKFSRTTEAFGEKAVRYFVSNDSHGQLIENVRCLHWRDFLKEIFGSIY